MFLVYSNLVGLVTPEIGGDESMSVGQKVCTQAGSKDVRYLTSSSVRMVFGLGNRFALM